VESKAVEGNLWKSQRREEKKGEEKKGKSKIKIRFY